MTSWLMGAKPDIGVGYDMQSITVAVLGGTSMAGGTGKLAGNAVGGRGNHDDCLRSAAGQCPIRMAACGGRHAAQSAPW
jgi:hypothetical protein